MSLPDHLTAGRIYALRLLADPADALALRGRLEHVISGRCHEFSTGQQLLACLARELNLLSRADPPPTGVAAPAQKPQ